MQTTRRQVLKHSAVVAGLLAGTGLFPQYALAFNKAAGFTDKDDQLPDFFKNEALPPHNLVWDFSVEEMQAAKV